MKKTAFLWGLKSPVSSRIIYNEEIKLLTTKNLNSPDTIIAIASVVWELLINNQTFITLEVIDDLVNDFFETIDDPACYTVLKRG